MKAIQRRTVWRDGAGRSDDLAEEMPVAFEYNGISHAVMLATPDDLEDFAVGFSLSEGIVARRRDIFDIGIRESAAGISLQIEIAGDAFARLKAHRRSLAGRTGCGLCGVESLDQVRRELAPLPATKPFPLAALHAGMRSLPAQQLVQQATGATHAACRVGRDGVISHVREDVGRHNALDKTLGALARDGVDALADQQHVGRTFHHQPRQFRDGAEGCGAGHRHARRGVRTDGRGGTARRQAESEPDRLPAPGKLRHLQWARHP